MTAFPTIGLDAMPVLTADQMREVDRLMVDEAGIDLARMMENAGANLASLAINLFEPDVVCVLAGPGGNGGGGLAAARHLYNRGVEVTVVPSHGREAFTPVPGEQLEILRRMGVAIGPDPQPADLVIDALIGYSLHGPPRGRTAELIRRTNDGPGPVLSLDVPSGVDSTTGEVLEPSIRATATMTLALPKTGLRAAAPSTGRLFLADISVPETVYRRVGITMPPIFAGGRIVELAG